MKNLIEYLKQTLSNNFISHVSEAEWGTSVFFMERSGRAFARTYWFADDNTTIYFDWLGVDSECRKQGFGSELLNAHINSAKEFKLESILWVDKDSWMHDWYGRKGYVNYKINEKENNAIWMKLK